MFYIVNISKCYCETERWYNRVDSECFNFTNDTDIREWWYQCADGRPYNIKTQSHLKADIKYIDCTDYQYHINFSVYDYDYNCKIRNEWTKRALSEHASIGTFAKFTLQLMSIGAPIWILKLSNKASLDEIKHTQLSFDIVNMYNNNNNGQMCITYDQFPVHSLNIDNDWNEILRDTAIGGCIGETISVFEMATENKYNNVIDDIVYEIAQDEIRHAALAWITVKWIIDKAGEEDIDIIDVENRNWWERQMRKLDEENKNVIDGILDKIWIDTDNYHQTYSSIINELELELNIRLASQ